MKAIILARVSTEEQMDGYSIPAQLEKAREYAKRKELDVAEVYQFDESSSIDQRKKFDNVVNYIKHSTEKVALVVETVDRLQRSFKETVLLDEYRKLGKLDIHFIRENLIIHKDSNSSEMQRWHLAVFVANSYVLQLSDNVKRSIEKKIKNGEFTSKAPIGYLNVNLEGKNTIIPDSGRSHYVVKMFELYSQRRFSFKTISEEMRSLGLVTASGKDLATSQIERIIKNPFYHGVMQIKGAEFPHCYKPLITKELYDECQKIRLGYRKKPFQYAAKPFALRGIIKCDFCGCMITPQQQGKYIYYTCTNYRKNCKPIYIREEELLEPIVEKLKTMKVPEDTAKEIIEEFKKENQSEIIYHKNALASLRTEHEKIQNRKDEVLNLLLDKLINKEEYDRKMTQLRERQEEISQSMLKHESFNEDSYLTIQKIFDLANNAHHLFESSEPNEKRQLIDFLVQNCRLRGRNLMFTIREPFDNLFSYSHLKFWLGSWPLTLASLTRHSHPDKRKSTT